MGLEVRQPDEQLQDLADIVLDDRGVVPTPWEMVNGRLLRGGLAPGTLTVLGGRPRTRKTTVMMNLIAGFLRQGHAVGLVGLDEPNFVYVAKLASVISGVPHTLLMEEWDSPAAARVRGSYLELTEDIGRFVMAKGHRPNTADLSAWREMSDFAQGGRKPDIIFVDYVGKMARDGYPGRENERIPRLMEDLSVWAQDEEVVLIALHHVGRTDEGAGVRYHGDTPMTLEGLKYGGEEVADHVFGTYRPALDPLGNMSEADAVAFLGDRYDEDRYLKARRRVERYESSTFLQLLKNRTGVGSYEHGWELVSPNESQQLVPAQEAVNDDMQLEAAYA